MIEGSRSSRSKCDAKKNEREAVSGSMKRAEKIQHHVGDVNVSDTGERIPFSGKSKNQTAGAQNPGKSAHH